MSIIFQKYYKVSIVYFLIVLFAVFIAIFAIGNKAQALPVVGFNAGNIMSDGVFTNYQSMNASQIQSFLNSKVPVCDTWGTNGSTTTSRRDFIRSHGSDTPLICLRDYQENGKSAAQIIYDASQEFHINPQVLIVLLQKEQGLVTDDWPGPWQYKTATGYGCPDTAECDTQYYGFTNQVRWSARMFRAIMNNSPTWYTPYILGNNYVQYSPNASCGGTIVNIQNRATQSLYNYTPYQPNQSALDAGYGIGDTCGAYGNRNFYLYFNDWFGSTQSSIFTNGVSITQDDAGQMFTKQPTTISFTIRNLTKSEYSFKYLGVAIRGPSGENLDPGWSQNVTLAPGATYEYKATRTLTTEGEYKIYISSYANQDSGWRECYPSQDADSCYKSKVFQNPIEVTATPIISKTDTDQTIDSLRRGQAFNVSYTIKNTSELYNATPGLVMIAGRTTSGLYRDFHMKNPGVLVPGQLYKYTDGATYNDSIGTSYRFYISATQDGGKTYREMEFKPTNVDIKQEVKTSMKPIVAISQGIANSGNLIVGVKNTVSFKITNYGDNPVNLGRVGVTVRGPNGENKDPKWELVDNLSGEYNYSASFIPTSEGKWTISYMSTLPDYSKWDNNTPFSNDASIKRFVIVNAINSTVLFQGPQLNIPQVHLGQATQITQRIKTLSETSVNLGRVGVTVRGPNGENKDPKWELVDNLSVINQATPLGIYTYQANFNPTSTGLWRIGYMGTTPNYTNWTSLQPKSDNENVERSITVNVLPQATITSGISISGATLGVQQASFTVTNNGLTSIDLGKLGLAVRDPNNINRDALWQDFTISANSSMTYTVNINLNKIGKWSFVITNYKNGVWSSATPVSESGDLKRELIINAK